MDTSNPSTCRYDESTEIITTSDVRVNDLDEADSPLIDHICRKTSAQAHSKKHFPNRTNPGHTSIAVERKSRSSWRKLTC